MYSPALMSLILSLVLYIVLLVTCVLTCISKRILKHVWKCFALFSQLSFTFPEMCLDVFIFIIFPCPCVSDPSHVFISVITCISTCIPETFCHWSFTTCVHRCLDVDMNTYLVMRVNMCIPDPLCHWLLQCMSTLCVHVWAEHVSLDKFITICQTMCLNIFIPVPSCQNSLKFFHICSYLSWPVYQNASYNVRYRVWLLELI